MPDLRTFVLDARKLLTQEASELIEQVMRQCDGVQVKAATRLGINRNTLHKKIEEFRTQDAKADALSDPSEADPDH